MNNLLSHTVCKWLQLSGIQISRSYFNEQLQSHPDYPSLLCITDALDGMGIDNAAVVIDKDKLQHVPCPFLAFNRVNKTVIIIKNIRQQIIDNPEFEKHWDGTALFVEKREGWLSPENRSRLAIEKKNRFENLTLFLLPGLLIFLGLLNNYSWGMMWLLLVSAIGIFITTTIVQHELGISNEFAEQLCGAAGNSGCNAVIHSRGSRLGKLLNLADAGIIYFISYTFLLIGFLYQNNVAGIKMIAVVSLVSIPFTLYSVVYQWRVAKKWCRLCLLTVGVLWLQILILFFADIYKNIVIDSIILAPVLYILFVFFTVAAVWLRLVKPALTKNKTLLREKFGLQQFKNDPELFDLLLKKERRVDATPFEGDLQLGNPAANIQIMVACNPFCGPCAKAHKTLHELLEKNDIGLTVRFNVTSENPEDKKTRAIQYLLQLLNNSNIKKKREVLYEWFDLMDYDKFVGRFPLSEGTVDVARQLSQQQEWTKTAEIKFTPTIFMNDYELPKQYRAVDLKFLVRCFNRSEAIIKEETTEIDYMPA